MLPPTDPLTVFAFGVVFLVLILGLDGRWR
jgi:hypothetical protein